jgi:hypothetical protein
MNWVDLPVPPTYSRVDEYLEWAKAWCQEQWGHRWEAVGDREGIWTVFWGGNQVENYPSTYQWWFETEQQQMLFTLRWLS